jgi:hypothetical protein
VIQERVVVAGREIWLFRSRTTRTARTRRYEEGDTMASLYVWKGNWATVCQFHKTPSDSDYEPFSAAETQEFVRMLQAEGLTRVTPWEPCEMGYGGSGPKVR